MRKLMIALALIASSQALADGINQTAQEVKRKEFLTLICGKATNRQNLQKEIDYENAGGDPNAIAPGPNQFKIDTNQALLDEGAAEFSQLKSYFPKWFSHEFEYLKDCSKEARGIL